MYQSVRDGFLRFSTPLEGQVEFMYLDVFSLVSTGIGNLLDADSATHFGTNPQPLPDIFTLSWFDKITHAPVGHDEILVEYRTVKFSGTAHATLAKKEEITRLRITVDDIRALCATKLDSFEATLTARPPFSGFDDWPADAQLGLLSMSWALGPAFRFPAFEAAAASGDWLGMAAECHMSETGNPGVVPRNVRNQLLFTIAGWNAADPPGDFSFLIFDTRPGVTLADTMRSNAFPIPMNLDIGVQTALEALGGALGEPSFDPHGLDGVWGTGTRNALVAYQTSRGLPPTPSAKHIADIGRACVDALAADLDAAGFSRFP